MRYSKLVIEKRSVIKMEIDDPLIGQKYGWPTKEIRVLFVTNRFKEDVNYWEGLNSFPIYVRVLIPIKVENSNPISFSDLREIAWACIYNNEEDAKNHTF